MLLLLRLPVFFLTGIEIGVLLTSIAVSAAVSAASYALNYFLTPKPKPIEKGRLQGDIQLQDSQHGVVIPAVYGARPSEVVGGETVYGPGGVKMAGNIIWSSGIRKTVTTTPGRSGKGAKAPDTRSYSYDLDLAILLGKGPLRVLKIWANTDLIYDVTAPATGVYDPDLDPDDSYDPNFPPDPNVTDAGPGARYGKQPATDSSGTTSATLLHGNYAALRIYEGNETQLPDPLIEGVVDAQYGAGSTPAYRGNCYVVLEKFVIDRWGTVPNLVFLVENTAYTTLRQMAEQRCAAVGLSFTDYNFENLDAYPLRGLYINQREAPRRALENAGRLFGVDFITHDGLVQSVMRRATSVATITADELGLTEGEAAEGASAHVPPRLETRLVDEVQLPRRIDLKFFDPEKDHQVSTAGAFKQITRSEKHETIETPLTLTSGEARQMAERELVAAWIEQAAQTFSLGPKYAWLRPSDVVQIIRDGFTHLVRVVEIQGAVPGALKMSAVAADAAIYDVVAAAASQPAPPVTVKLVANTVVALMDVPWLRDQDTTPGFYAAATTRGGYEWPGASLYVDRGAGWESVAEFTAPAVMGRAVTTLPNGSSPGSTFDTVNSVTVDLYWGELDSATAAQVLDGANFAVVGNEVIQFQTASRVSGYANRWTLSALRRGQKKTGGYTATHASGERFVLLNSAVRFVPMQLAELGLQRTWKGVTAGQSIESAAPLTFAWQGQQVVPDTPQGFTVTFIGGSSGQADDLVYQWTAQPGITYELSADNTFTSILWRGQASGWRETSPGRNRAGWTRYLRATLSGVPSAGYATASYGVSVPPPPRIGTRRQTATSLVLQIGQQSNLNLPITDPATLGQVRNTVVEIADDAAFTQNLQVERRPGVRTDLELAGTPGRTVYVRTYFETIFGDTTPVSETYQHTFALGGDGGDGSGARFGNIWFEPDNTYDIGRNPSSNVFDRRPRDLYLARHLHVDGVITTRADKSFEAETTPNFYETWLWPRFNNGGVWQTILRPASGGLRIQDNQGTRDNLKLENDGTLKLGGHQLCATDNTYDLGASGANRPRDLFLARTLTIGGTLAQAATCALNAPTTQSTYLQFLEAGLPKWWLYKNGGDATLYLRDMANGKMHVRFVPGAQELLSYTVLSSNLTFNTDNAVDIGGAASGRPRDLYVGRNLTISDTVTMGGGTVKVYPAGSLPAAAGSLLVLAGGFGSPVAARYFIGDGSSWRVHWSKRLASTTTDLFTFDDRGYFIAQQNSVFYLSNLSDPYTNFERACHKWAGNEYVIGTEQGGTGQARNLLLQPAGALAISTVSVIRRGPNSATLTEKYLTELVTIAAAASTDSTIQIPAGAQVMAVSACLVTAGSDAGLDSYTVGVAGDPARYGTLPNYQGSSADGARDAIRYYSAATKIRLTPSLTPTVANAQIRLVIWLRQFAAPTS